MKANNARLLVVLVPLKSDLDRLRERYVTIRELMDRYSIEFVDPLDHLKKESYNKAPNSHWNDQGHSVVWDLTLKAVEKIMAEKRSSPSDDMALNKGIVNKN